MTSPGFDSGGFLSSDEAILADFASVAMTLDGRPMTAVSGTWNATGTKATTSTARTSDPKLILEEAPFSDFDFKVDVGLGDAMYVRWVDPDNWIRVTHSMVYSSDSYACNPYACNPYACNPVACNPYACNPYACNPYACNPYACNPYSCNCVAVYTTANSYTSNAYCTKSGVSPATPNCRTCDACCFVSCPAGYTNAGSSATCLNDSSCTKYAGQSCSTCYQTCYQTCFQTCFQTCYQTCYSTCYDTCFQTCYNYYYPTSVRVEKMVAGVLSTVADVNVGTAMAAGANTDQRLTWMRVIGKGTSIQVFGDRSPTTAIVSTTVAEHVGARKFGVGRVGYGNQDGGSVLDNLVLTNAK